MPLWTGSAFERKWEDSGRKYPPAIIVPAKGTVPDEVREERIRWLKQMKADDKKADETKILNSQNIVNE